ncbi:NAD(P)/FAD-dependent oxidoreductase [Caproiciproducens faecalis]|uniref:NAD(P)/FAD-dependent oxidoreductase n=1 Tax=Caproiciproducens faecalis TaxID=2820301 RepID=A0ABS7DP35_9FIRM|nr:NAD(P)/FAD-dependent oxidoreductase [Caproiciproducens faecalis]MBW7573069.1 NAD(P)/FAD-dependent oxidoreductase [Caproiciproducens faecalis]
MADIIILGNGPAGISSAAYTARAGLDTIVIGRDSGALSKAGEIENYYGFPAPISGEQLVQNGIDQAARLGVSVISDEVLGVSYDGEFTVQSKQGTYQAPCVILATGASRKVPRIEGLSKFEGKGVSYCAVCDAFFYRGKAVAVLGDGDYALHEASELLPVVGSVTVLTNGRTPSAQFPEQISVITKEIEALRGDSVLESIAFRDGSTQPLSGLFIALGVASSADFARTMGAETEGSRIVVNDSMQTSIPGLYAAGDCTGGMYQISKAVYDGARAATSAIQYLRGRKKTGDSVKT